MKNEVANARIESTRLGFGNDHGFLDHMLFLDYGGWPKGWGGYVLGFQDGRPSITSIAGDAIIAILNTIGVTDWEELKGKHCRAYKQAWGTLYGIGNFLKDKWVWFDDDGVKTGTLAELKKYAGE